MTVFTKKTILWLLIMISTLEISIAKWDGFYGRSGLSIYTHGRKQKKISSNFAVAAGYGVILPNYFHQGLYIGGDVEPIRKSFYGYSHEMILKIGIPQTQYMPYLGPKLGYQTSHGFTFSGLRAGINFDFILPGFFWGVELNWTIPFSKVFQSTLQSDFTFGYRF